MQKKIINRKKFTLDIDKIYKNDFNLIRTIAQTKKMRHNNKSLEVRKNNLKELITEINNEYKLNNNNISSRKNLNENNSNFITEYEMFNKKSNRKETKDIFKDLIKLYKSKGYRIPNFSINKHNLFKINPLLESNIDIISNGLLENQISQKKDDSEKILQYLKKIGIILSEKMSSSDGNLQKSLMKKFNLPKYKVNFNEEDTVENLKKTIEIITKLINNNALSKLDHKNRRIKNISRQNSYISVNYNSNKRVYLLNKENKEVSRRPSQNSNRVIKNGTFKENKNLLQETRNSNNSSLSNNSLKSNNNFNKKLSNYKSSESIYKIFNF